MHRGEESVAQLKPSGITVPPPASRFLLATTLLLSNWIGVNAVWGLTSDDQTMLSAWLDGMLPLPYWIGAGILCGGIAVLHGQLIKSRTQQALGAMLAAHLLGVLGSRYLYLWLEPAGGVPIESLVDGFRAIWERSFVLMPAVPMLLVYAWLIHPQHPETLRLGVWRDTDSRSGQGKARRDWLKYLGWYLLLPIVPAFLVMHWGREFEGITQGTLFRYFIPVVLVALFNGFTEEFLFRGLIQPALIDFLGKWPGLVMQGLFFGFLHWGSSPELIAGLPIALAVSALGVLWGYSVISTRGMAWAVLSHALADFVFFSAYFV